MEKIRTEETTQITNKAKTKLEQLLAENSRLKEILISSNNESEVNSSLKEWSTYELQKNKQAYMFYKNEVSGRKIYEKLTQKETAAIRILDYIDHSNIIYDDLNVKNKRIINNPFKILWLAAKYGTGGGKYFFFADMLELFRQFSGTEYPLPSKQQVENWMEKHPSGLDENIIIKRGKNKERIINIIIELIDSGKIKSRKYVFDHDMTHEKKKEKVNEWWNTKRFHIKFSARDPEMLNRMLNYSLDSETMTVLRDAEKKGIPFFVNPYYLSLLDTDKRKKSYADSAIRAYMLYSRNFVNEFGNIIAWEKEDIVEPGKPNAAGWILPTAHNIHRRYPEVAILIPESMGRACGGLCSSCQRMYDFQNGNLNFDFKSLIPNEKWPEKQKKLLNYFETDKELKDILITGGDAFMSSDKTLDELLNAVCEMAQRKRENNKLKSEKSAEIIRVRLGSRLPVYLPQRITPKLIKVLSDFRKKGSEAGIKQFIIQTHFESAMEITPEVKKAVRKIIKAGWIVTNQLVFTAAASRRGHTNKLRKVLNNIGVITYYTFSVKGYMENYHSFATNARAVQEQIEEKKIGRIPDKYIDFLKSNQLDAGNIVENINLIRDMENLPFLATDRNVLNLPGVGKSLTFRTVGITRRGRRILKFDHDTTRNHSPVIEQMDNIIIIESKPVGEYLRQLSHMGEDPDEYKTIWGYSIGETEPRFPAFEYPEKPDNSYEENRQPVLV